MLSQVCFCLLLLIKCYGYQNSWNSNYNNYKIPQEVMVDVVNNLALKLLAIHNEGNNNNIAISPYGALSVLVALGEGLRGDAVFEIQKSASIPSDISTIRVGLRDIHRHLKSYFIPEEGFLSGLSLSHDNVTLNREYEDILKFYGYDITSFNNALYPDLYTTARPFTTTEVTTETSTNTESITDQEATVEMTTEMGSTTSDLPTTRENDRTTRSESTTMPTESIVITTTSAEPTKTSEITTLSESTTSVITTTTPLIMTSTTGNMGKSTTAESTTPLTTTTPLITTSTTGNMGKSTTLDTVTTAESTTPVITTTTPLITTSTTSNVGKSTTLNIITTTEMPSTMQSITSDQPLSTTEMMELTAESTTKMVETTTMSSTTETTTATEGTTNSATEAFTTNQNTQDTTSISTTVGDLVEVIDNVKDNDSSTLSEIKTTTEDSSTLSTENTESTSEIMSTTNSDNNSDSSTIMGRDSGSDEHENNETVRRNTRSVVDYVIARYYDDHYITQRPPPYNSEKDLYFLINGKTKEYNINYMTYDTVLPFHYILHLNALALRFPLDSSKYYLLLLLPENVEDIDKLICNLRLNTSLKYIINHLRYTHVKAIIPSFMLKGYIVLTSTFQKMGIKRVFEPRQADFSPMTSDRNIYVTNIEQAITVNIRNYVDPVTMNNNRYLHQNDPVLFKADHPFLYFVIDSEIDVTLMAGKIINPLNSRIR